METPVVTAPEPPYDEDSWQCATGETLLPGLLAWTPLGDGVRRETWLAWSMRHWTAVAVKLPRPSLVGEPRLRTTLRDEAAILRRILHPGFQRLLYDGSAEPVPHLVLEYVEGPSLGMVLDDGPLGVPDVLLLGMHLGTALHYLHGAGLVHRDLKPDNIVIREGRPVLLDLGLARPAGTPGRADAPQGTDGYMAPEQRDGSPAAPSADLYGLGVVLIEALAGLSARDPDDLPADLPDGVADLLRRLVHPEPAARPPSAAALLAELRARLPEHGETPWPPWVDAALDRTSAP